MPTWLSKQIGTMHDFIQWPVLYFVQSIEGFVMFISFFISLSNICKNRNKWNKEIENNIFKRQLTFIIIRMLTVFFSQIFWHILNLYSEVWYINDNDKKSETVVIPFLIKEFLQSINICRGIFYTFWLLTDPLIRNAIVKKYMKLLETLDFTNEKEEKMKDKADNILNHPMNAFLCSSMNMELVCAILQGIQIHIQSGIIFNLV